MQLPESPVLHIYSTDSLLRLHNEQTLKSQISTTYTRTPGFWPLSTNPPYTINIAVQATDLNTISMEEPTGRSRPWLNRISLYESSVLDSPLSICRRRRRDTSFLRRSNYDIVFFMTFFSRWNETDLTKWYKIKVCAESRVKLENEITEIPEIHPFWGEGVPTFASFAAVGSDIYCFGGERLSDPNPVRSLSDVYKLVTNFPFPTDTWFQMPSMKFSRIHPHTLVLDGKIYVVGGHTFSDHRPRKRNDDDMSRRLVEATDLEASDVEVYDPATGEWKALPRPPIPIETDYICAALENPNRILVASLSTVNPEALVFYQYYVQEGCWRMLEKPEREFDCECPLGHGYGHGGKAITVGNTLYWVTRDTSLLAYDVVQDVWLLGRLKHLGISFLQYDEPRFSLIHLEGERFAMMQCVCDNEVEVECVIIDVCRKPCNNINRRPIYRGHSDERLEISVVSVHKYKTESNSSVKGCFLMGK